jgi:hypothetical protein
MFGVLPVATAELGAEAVEQHAARDQFDDAVQAEATKAILRASHPAPIEIAASRIIHAIVTNESRGMY